MFKVMAFLVKVPGIDRDQLIEHYERRHVPLILSLGPAPLRYQRNYVQHDGAAPPQHDVDIITELTFPDRATYETWVHLMYAPDSGVAADEETFLDRARTRSFVVEEHPAP